MTPKFSTTFECSPIIKNVHLVLETWTEIQRSRNCYLTQENILINYQTTKEFYFSAQVASFPECSIKRSLYQSVSLLAGLVLSVNWKLSKSKLL